MKSSPFGASAGRREDGRPRRTLVCVGSLWASVVPAMASNCSKVRTTMGSRPAGSVRMTGTPSLRADSKMRCNDIWAYLTARDKLVQGHGMNILTESRDCPSLIPQERGRIEDAPLRRQQNSASLRTFWTGRFILEAHAFNEKLPAPPISGLVWLMCCPPAPDAGLVPDPLRSPFDLAPPTIGLRPQRTTVVLAKKRVPPRYSRQFRQVLALSPTPSPSGRGLFFFGI